jgi:hypothetical protein
LEFEKKKKGRMMTLTFLVLVLVPAAGCDGTAVASSDHVSTGAHERAHGARLAGPAGHSAAAARQGRPVLPPHDELQLVLGALDELPRLLERHVLGRVGVDLGQDVALAEPALLVGYAPREHFLDVDLASEDDAEICKLKRKKYTIFLKMKIM